MDALEQLDDLPVYTIPNQHPPKMDVLPKTFLHSSLRHSFQVHPQNSSDDLFLLFFMNPSSMNHKL